MTRPEPSSKPSRQLQNELRSLYYNFAKEVEDTCLIAESLTKNFEASAESVLALSGGTDLSIDAPMTFQVAWHHPDAIKQELWRKAIQKEFQNMIQQGVWRNHSKYAVAENRQIIDCKWIFRVKNDGRHRAQLCTISYTQVVDFQDNFAPVVNNVAFCIAIVMMLANGWDANIVDVETAFLYGDLNKEIYMKVPEGLVENLNTEFKNDNCLVLVQAMYCLVQAARQYYKKFIDVMVTKIGFDQCLSNSCLLKRTDNDNTIIIFVYMDDFLCIGDRKTIDLIKKELSKYVSVKDTGKMEEYVGCLVVQNAIGNIILHQPHFLKKINLEFGDKLKNTRTPSTPAGSGDAVVKMDNNGKAEGGLPKEQQTHYCSGVGMLLYFVNFLRPDISNSTQELTKSMDFANKEHYKALTCVLKYVISTKKLGIKYDLGAIVNFNRVWKIIAYCDSNFA